MSRLPAPMRGFRLAACGWRGDLRGVLLGVLALLLVGSAGACGEVDGESSAFPGTTVYESSTGEYQFNLLEPPWRRVLLSSETIFVVPPMIATLLPTESDALYSLHIYRHTTDAASALQADAPARSGSVSTQGPSQVAASGGSTGVEMSWAEDSATFHRDAYINIPTAGISYRMHFSAATALADDSMISQMIVSFRPGSKISGGK